MALNSNSLYSLKKKKKIKTEKTPFKIKVP